MNQIALRISLTCFFALSLTISSSSQIKSFLETVRLHEGAFTLTVDDAGYDMYVLSWNHDQMQWDSSSHSRAMYTNDGDAVALLLKSYYYDDERGFVQDLEVTYHNYVAPPAEYDCEALYLPHFCDYIIFPFADSMTYTTFYEGDTSRGVINFSTGANGLVDTLAMYYVESDTSVLEEFIVNTYDESDRLVTSVNFSDYAERSNVFMYNDLGQLDQLREFRKYAWDTTIGWARTHDHSYDEHGRVELVMVKTYGDSLITLESVDSIPTLYLANSVQSTSAYDYWMYSDEYRMAFAEWNIAVNDTLSFQIRYDGAYRPELQDLVEKRTDSSGNPIVNWYQRSTGNGNLVNSALVLVDYGEGMRDAADFVLRTIDEANTTLPSRPADNYAHTGFRWDQDLSDWRETWTKSAFVDNSADKDMLITRSTYVDFNLGAERVTSTATIYGYQLPEDLSECIGMPSDKCAYTSYPTSSLSNLRYPFFDSVASTSYSIDDSIVTVHRIRTNEQNLVDRVQIFEVKEDGTRALTFETSRTFDDAGRMTSSMSGSPTEGPRRKQFWEYDEQGNEKSYVYVYYDIETHQVDFASSTRFYYDEQGLLKNSRTDRYSDSLMTILVSDSSHYLRLTDKLVIQQNFQLSGSEIQYYVSDRWLVNEGDSLSLSMFYIIYSHQPHIVFLEEYELDDQFRHQAFVSQHDFEGTGVLNNNLLSLYEYGGVSSTREERTGLDKPGFEYIVLGSEIQLFFDNPQNGNVYFYSTSGQLLAMSRVEGSSVELHCHDLPTGVYYLNIATDKMHVSTGVFISGEE